MLKGCLKLVCWGENHFINVKSTLNLDMELLVLMPLCFDSDDSVQTIVFRRKQSTRTDLFCVFVLSYFHILDFTLFF